MTLTISYCVALFTQLVLSSTQPPALSVTISHLRNSKGHVLISLFRDGQGFPDNGAIAFRKASLEIRDKKAAVQFPGLPAGRYAIAILHDENDDGKMNKNALGMPKEGYGFSNNVTGAFGPPAFWRASFDYAAGTAKQLTIKTRY